MPELVTNCRVPSDSQEKRECKNPGEADYSTREVMLHAARKQRYSVFTKWQKRWIVFLTVFAGWFSALSSFIFFPAITALANALHTSIEKLNLTVTSYLIFAAVAPSVVGSWADMSGRRPVYIVTLTIYVAANIGLALQGSFAALFVLRMLQSAGISGTFAVTYGVVADIASPAERGSFVSAVAFGTNTAPSIGPVLGAVLNARAGWRWIFWFLAILSGACLAAICFSLPETAHNVVGNGSIPAHGIHKVPFKKMAGRQPPDEPVQVLSRQRRGQIPNPLTCLVVLSRRDSAIVLLGLSIQYMTYTCLQATLSTLFIQIYGFSQLQAGLIYLPYGLGCAIMGCLIGKLIDRDYRVTAEAHGFVVDKKYGDELFNFPIEKARLRSFFYPLTLAVASIIGYGWSLDARAHFAVPLALQFIIGCSILACNTILNTLLTDLNQESASTAQAACNIVRCLLAAAAMSCIQIIIDHVGVGFCFTIIAAITALCLPLLAVERAKGLGWRQSRERGRANIIAPAEEESRAGSPKEGNPTVD